MRLLLRLSRETKREIQYVFVSHGVFVVGHPFHFEGVTHPMGITTLDSLVELFSWFWELGWGEMSHGDFFLLRPNVVGSNMFDPMKTCSSSSLSYSHQNQQKQNGEKEHVMKMYPSFTSPRMPFPPKKHETFDHEINDVRQCLQDIFGFVDFLCLGSIRNPLLIGMIEMAPGKFKKTSAKWQSLIVLGGWSDGLGVSFLGSISFSTKFCYSLEV